jgi:hypothetical protein
MKVSFRELWGAEDRTLRVQNKHEPCNTEKHSARVCSK